MAAGCQGCKGGLDEWSESRLYRIIAFVPREWRPYSPGEGNAGKR